VIVDRRAMLKEYFEMDIRKPKQRRRRRRDPETEENTTEAAENSGSEEIDADEDQDEDEDDYLHEFMLYTIPVLLPQYVPSLSKLPQFLVRLGSEVNIFIFPQGICYFC
jgi:hypothetical protein